MKNLFLLSCLLLLAGTTIGQTSGGPDAYGYTWTDSNDPNGPTYSWIDLTSISSAVQTTGLADDNAIPAVPMTSFYYYWENHNQIKIGSNGWLSFNNIGNIGHCFPNMPTSGGAADNFIAPFMTDLNFSGAGNVGEVWYHDDLVNNRFVVSYLNVPIWTAIAPGYIGSHSFQVILSRADSSITYQYEDIDQVNFTNAGGCNGNMVIGIENNNGVIGLQHSNNVVPPDNYAIRFDYPAIPLIAVEDPAAAWNQNNENKGDFYRSNALIPITTEIANFGNAANTTTINVVIEVLDALNQVVYTHTDSITGGLASGGSVQINGPDAGPYSPGQYSMRTSVSNAQDFNLNNNILINEIQVVDFAASVIPMSYASGNAPDGSVSWTSGGRSAVYHEPPLYPMTLDSVELYISSPQLDVITVSVYDDDGTLGMPGTLLQQETISAANYVGDSWNTFPLTNAVNITSGGVYLAFENVSNPNNSLGTEVTQPISRRSLEYNSGWATYRQNNNTDLLIRGWYYSQCGGFVASVNGSTDLSCANSGDGSIDLGVVGGTSGYTYTWSNGATTEDISGLFPGTYTVTVTDANGCSSSASAVITEPTAITGLTTSTDEACFGDLSGSVDLSVTGGTPSYTYLWSDGSTTEDLNNVAAGTYTVTITDGNGCSTLDTAVVAGPLSAISAAPVSTDITCFGDVDGAIDLSTTGGTPGYTFLWSNGDTTEDLSGLAAGTYMVTITDNEGCTESASISITEPATLASTGSGTDEMMGNDGTIDLTVTGGVSPYTFSWSNGETTEDLSGLVAGTYTVTVTDANGCTTMLDVTIGSQVGIVDLSTQAVQLYPNPTTGTLTMTFSGEITIQQVDVYNLPGQQVHTQTGQFGQGSTLDLSGLPTGTYLVRLQAANGTFLTRRVTLVR